MLTIKVQKAADVRQSVDDNLRTGGLLGLTKDIVDPFVIVSYGDKSYRYSVYLLYWYKITNTDRSFCQDNDSVQQLQPPVERDVAVFCQGWRERGARTTGALISSSLLRYFRLLLIP